MTAEIVPFVHRRIALAEREADAARQNHYLAMRRSDEMPSEEAYREEFIAECAWADAEAALADARNAARAIYGTSAPPGSPAFLEAANGRGDVAAALASDAFAEAVERHAAAAVLRHWPHLGDGPEAA